MELSTCILPIFKSLQTVQCYSQERMYKLRCACPAEMRYYLVEGPTLPKLGQLPVPSFRESAVDHSAAATNAGRPVVFVNQTEVLLSPYRDGFTSMVTILLAWGKFFTKANRRKIRITDILGHLQALIGRRVSTKALAKLKKHARLSTMAKKQALPGTHLTWKTSIWPKLSSQITQ